jgi:hypothetical protein
MVEQIARIALESVKHISNHISHDQLGLSDEELDKVLRGVGEEA